MKVIGITGRSGSGKSTLAAALGRKGAAVLDGDTIAEGFVQPGSPLLERISKEFGEEFLRSDGSLDRKMLGELVFSDPASLSRLNSIVHPAFKRGMEDVISSLRRSATPPGFAVIDAAVLFEAGLDGMCDLIVAVSCCETESARRLAARDGMTMEGALARIRAQKVKVGEYKMSRMADVNVISRGDPAEMDLWANRVIRICGGR